MSYLSIETLQEVAPSVFATSPDPKMSNKYTFVPTIEIIENFSREGWNVSSVKQSGKSKYGQHELRLRNGALPNVGDSLIEAVIRNSHNGLSSFSVSSGLHRVICKNGLSIPTSVADKMSVRHKSVDMGVIRQITDQFADRLPIIQRSVGKMESVFLKDGQIDDFVNKAKILRWEMGSVPTSINVEDFIRPNRDGDVGNSVWKVFNVIQEKMIRGGLKYESKKGRHTTMKELKNFHTINKINTNLWELAESYC
jgi:hypothetical protein